MSTSPTTPATVPMSDATALHLAAVACEARADWHEDLITGQHTVADDHCRAMRDEYRAAAARMTALRRRIIEAAS